MEMFLLAILILMSAVVITYSGEIWLYICLTIGSIIKDIKNKFNTTITRKK